MLRSNRHSIRPNGFTYLWVLFTIALIGLGLTVAAEIDATVVQRSREKELLAIGRQFRDAINSYYDAPQVSQREYPPTLEDLLKDRRLPMKRHLRKIYIDPMTGKDDWGLIKLDNRIVGVYSKSAKEPLKKDGFDKADELLKDKQKYSEWWFISPKAPLPQLKTQTGTASQAASSKP